MPCWWVGWWLWRAGCISQDTYLLYVIYFKIKQNLYSILNLVGARMFCELRFPFVSFITLVALEWSLQGMCLHVALQLTRRSTTVVALVTFERLFFCVHPHHVFFQLGSCVHEYSHIWHLCGFSPECDFLCLSSVPASVVLYSHWLQLYSFSPVCCLIWVLRLEAWLHE